MSCHPAGGDHQRIAVALDHWLSMDLNNVCKACCFHIWAMHHVQGSLPDDAAKTVACSIFSSWLDYCNALYSGMSIANYLKLQYVRNTLAHVFLRQCKHNHNTLSLVQLHWLPIEQGITFKIATLLKLLHLLLKFYVLINLLICAKSSIIMRLPVFF
jgi:hypothetical protein